MSITRKCGACAAMIERALCLELQARVMRTDGGPDQDAVAQAYDEYCDACIANGEALQDLLSGLPKYKLGGREKEESNGEETEGNRPAAGD